jgi:hypothetical protein
MEHTAEHVPFGEALLAVPNQKLKTLTQSSIPLMSYWRDEKPIIERLFDYFEMGPVDYELFFEYAVPSMTPQDPPASADLMLVSNELAVAFEANWQDFRQETVTEWIAQGDRSHRKKVVQHWVDMIQPVSNRKLQLDEFGDVVYSLLQSTATVCSIPAEKRAVNVLMFVEGRIAYAPKEYLNRFALLSRIIQSTSRLDFKMDLPIHISPNRHYHRLSRKLEKVGFKKAPDLIRGELIKHSLFKFDPPDAVIRYGSC